MPDIFRLMRELTEAQGGLEYLETFLRYVFSRVEDITETEIKDIVEQSLSQDKGEFVMTLAEKLLRRGREEGRRQGLLKAIDLGLLLRFGADGVALMPEVEKITDNQRLELLGDALKSVPTISDFEKLLRA